jgi:two-component system, NtrC family, response regulator HydG
MSRLPRAPGDDLEVDPDTRSTVARGVEEPGIARLRRAIVIEGPDTPQEFDLAPNTPSRILLGTSEVCALRLTDPTVSRRHAAFEMAGKRYRLTDLQSTNGTFVDGVRIVEAYVRGGEIVRCGSTAIRLEVDEAAPPPALSNAIRFGTTLGASIAMRRLYTFCERLAKSRLPIVIEGETGTGKEVLAESLYEASGAQGPFAVFDCTTISSNLVEAELFGHERGAFTGAAAGRPGVFEEADGGTLLIDEVGDLDLTLQSKLLRAIDRGEVRRIGGQKWTKVDVRVIAATRRDLDKAVAAGRFRDDLFHRLAVARIELPPLRERYGDVPLLARHFATELGGPPDQVEAEIEARYPDYNWPGNVRELRNAVARYIALGRDWDPPAGSELRVESAAQASGRTDWMDEILASGAPYPIARRRTVEEFERRYVERILAEHDGNVTHAARASGLAVRYFRLVKARRQPKE